jgi:dTDP-4-amino-4,6-dideoxygalactose transaminase
MKQIPFAVPDIGEEEIAEVSKTLRSGWLTMGRKTIEFEEALKNYTGAEQAIAVNSCTAALHLSLLAAGIKPGDEVITTPLTFAATANVIVHAGAIPVFSDIDSKTYNIDPAEIEKKLTHKTKAIIPVHYAGQPCDMAAIREIADTHDLVIIEDAAHAIGAQYRGEKVGNIKGSFSTCFSFYATKNMTTGEGGAITLNNEGVANIARNLRLHGMSKDAWKRYGPGESWKYDIVACGWKYNTTDINATLGLCQLRKLDAYNHRRKYLAGLYDTELEDIVGIQEVPKDNDHVQHLYPILVPHRDKFIEEMAKRGVSCSVHFIPLHLTKFYRNYYGYHPGFFPVCERIYENLVSIPLYPKMSDEDALYVVDCVKEVIGK